MKTPVSKKLSPISKHMSGKATLRGRPMRQRPSMLDSSATGKINPIIATVPKPQQMMNMPESHSQSRYRRMKGARTMRARSRRNMYLQRMLVLWAGRDEGLYQHS